MQTKKPLIQVLERAFDILEMLARNGKTFRSSEIAAELNLSQQTVNNLLRTLYERGYLSQNERREYRLGGQCFYLGACADRWQELRKQTGKILPALRKETGLTVFVGVLENDRLFCVAMNDLTPDRIAQNWTEELHSTASGQILLSALSAIERKKLFARGRRKKMTPATVVNADALEKLCRRIGEEGYAEIRGQSRPAVCSIAVPVRDTAGRVAAALALSGDEENWDRIPLERKLSLLRDAAGKVRIAPC